MHTEDAYVDVAAAHAICTALNVPCAPAQLREKLDARRTAVSHRDTSLELASSIQGDAASSDSDALLLAQIEGHKVASDRWRAIYRLAACTTSIT